MASLMEKEFISIQMEMSTKAHIEMDRNVVWGFTKPNQEKPSIEITSSVIPTTITCHKGKNFCTKAQLLGNTMANDYMIMQMEKANFNT